MKIFWYIKNIIFTVIITLMGIGCSDDSNYYLGYLQFTSTDISRVYECRTTAITLTTNDKTSSVTYDIYNQDSDEFNLDSQTGVVTFKILPDYETKNLYYFTASARNADSNATQDITIEILDINETGLDTQAPVFNSEATKSVYENQTDAITLMATDDKCRVYYTISGEDSASFNVNTDTGVVTFIVAPDFETKQSYTFTATATDTAGNASTQDVVITILNYDINHNGFSYESITSPYTNRIWLDKNLGAYEVCITLYDVACFGDYYQWGRDTDGHEKYTSSLTSTQATDIDNVGELFITSSTTYNYDWAQEFDSDGALREAKWSKTDGSSVCPKEYRVPTAQELSDETINIEEPTQQFNNFLNLPYSGYRSFSDGIIASYGFYGSVWSSSSSNGFSSKHLYFDMTMDVKDRTRSYGHSIRCIKD